MLRRSEEVLTVRDNENDDKWYRESTNEGINRSANADEQKVFCV